MYIYINIYFYIYIFKYRPNNIKTYISLFPSGMWCFVCIGISVYFRIVLKFLRQKEEQQLHFFILLQKGEDSIHLILFIPASSVNREKQ